MIHEIDINPKDPKKLPLDWWFKAKGLENRTKISFKPGLNVLVGPNGCGKSTVLRTIALMLHCAQGGIQLVSANSLFDLSGLGKDPTSVHIKHSGCPVSYFDVESTPGLIGGMAGFDSDFMSLGVQAATFKGSSGQEMMRKLQRIIADKPKPVKWKVKLVDSMKDDADEYDKKKYEYHQTIKRILNGDAELPKSPVVILDEPDRALDMLNQIHLWKLIIPMMVLDHGIQVIVTSHSLLAFDSKSVVPNFIELEDGYVEKCKKAIF